MIIYAVILCLLSFFIGKLLNKSIKDEFLEKINNKFLFLSAMLLVLVIGFAFPHILPISGLFAYWGGNLTK